MKVVTLDRNLKIVRVKHCVIIESMTVLKIVSKIIFNIILNSITAIHVLITNEGIS